MASLLRIPVGPALAPAVRRGTTHHRGVPCCCPESERETMSDLIVDTPSLAETGSALRYLAGELRDAETIVEDHQRSIGHRRLAHQLDEMQGSWDDRRNDLRDAIEDLADVNVGAGQAFEEIEAELVAAMVGD